MSLSRHPLHLHLAQLPARGSQLGKASCEGTRWGVGVRGVSVRGRTFPSLRCFWDLTPVQPTLFSYDENTFKAYSNTKRCVVDASVVDIPEKSNDQMFFDLQ